LIQLQFTALLRCTAVSQYVRSISYLQSSRRKRIVCCRMSASRVLYAQSSQHGRMYHSCSVWSHSLRSFVFKPTVHPSQRCSVRFVFCDEHQNEQRASTVVTLSPSRRETPPKPDRSNDGSDGSDDAMDEVDRLHRDGVALSSLFTPPSPPDCAGATTTCLTVCQRDLIEQFGRLVDDLYRGTY
jgi:hypothetical protein